MRERTKEFLIWLAMGAVIAAGVFALNMSREFGLLRSLCDGPFVAAAFLLGIGGIKAVRNRGVFDVLGYGLRTVVDVTLPMLRREEKEDIHQYRERKAKERRESVGILLAGAVYLVISLLMLALYELLPA